MQLITIRLPNRTDDGLVRQWCAQNCIGRYYFGHDWDNWIVGEDNIVCQFESNHDATLFALRYT